MNDLDSSLFEGGTKITEQHAVVRLIEKIREAGRNGDYAKARQLMKRHANKLPAWRMQNEWATAYRQAIGVR